MVQEASDPNPRFIAPTSPVSERIDALSSYH